MAFFAAGVALASDLRWESLHPTLRARLDEAFGGFAIDSGGPGGRHDPVLSRVVLVEDASPRDGFVSLRARALAIRIDDAWERVEGGLVLSLSGQATAEQVTEWRAGRTIEAPITFRRPVRYENDGVPDFERELALDGVALLGTIKSPLLVEVVARGHRGREVTGHVRAHIRRAVSRWIGRHDEVSASIAAAVLIGDRTGLPVEVREGLQAAGTYHVMAISGGNIAILATTVSLLLLLVGIRGRSAALLATMVLLCYGASVTAGPSVWRATLMAVLFFTARALDHRTAAWHTLLVAASVLLVLQPLEIRDAGFILSFGATAALIGGARFGASRRPGNLAFSWVFASLAATTAVEVTLLPVSASLFFRATGAGLVLNLCAIPLMGLVQVAALVAVLAAPFDALASGTGWLAHVAAQALVKSADLVDLAPWMTARVPPPSLGVVVGYYVCLAALLASSTATRRAAAAGGLLVAALAVVGVIDLRRLTPESDGRLRLTVFDVGQGEALLLEAPGGRTLLVDTGGLPFGSGFDMGTRVLAPALWQRGVRRLDALLLTHADPDHAGGADAVVAEFRPQELWLGVLVPTHEPTGRLLAVASDRRIPVRMRRRGEAFEFGGARLRVLHPPEPDWERRRIRNDDSIVLEVVYGEVALLLTGDIGAEVEQALEGRLTNARTRVLKVAHHGSRTSSSAALLAAWKPQIALISVGRDNAFGHPAPDVLDRLEDVGAAVWRTDRDGQITLETDGYVLRVQP
jgi:competence protein ComEC